MKSSRLPLWCCYLLISIIALSSHVLYLKSASFFILTADQWIYPFVSLDWAFQGKVQAFPYQLSYGGLGITLLRILVTKFASLITSNPQVIWENVQIIFTYTATPVLVAWSIFFYLSRIVSRETALVVGAWAAVGFNYLIFLYGLDPFPSMICSLFLLLGIRGRLQQPLQELNLMQLLGSGLFLGFSSYVHRGTMLVAPAFLLSLPWAKDVVSRIRKADGLDKIILGFCSIFVLLSIYSNWHGREIGQIFGKQLIVDPHPNFKIALILFFVFLGRHYMGLIPKYFESKLRVRSLIFAVGFLMGLLPEVLSILFLNIGFFKPFPPSGQTSWGHVARALNQHLLGPLHWQADSIIIFRIVAGILAVSGVAAIFRSWKTKTFIWPVAFMFFLNLYLFFRVRNSTEGDPRYLLTFFPFFILSMALCWEDIKKYKMGKTFFLVILVLFSALQIQQRHAWLSRVADEQKYSHYQSVASLASQRGYDYVLTSDYWVAVPLSIKAHRKPVFVISASLRIPYVSDSEMLSAKKVGAYFMNGEQPPEVLSAFGGQWNVFFVEPVDNGFLAELVLKK